MNIRLLRCLFSNSLPYLSSLGSDTFFSSKSLTLCSCSTKISRRNLVSVTARFMSTTPHDDMVGLVDPDNSFLPEDSLVEPFLTEEFDFLRNSLLDSNADSGSMVPKFEAGKCSSEAAFIGNAILTDDDVFGNKTQKFLRQFREKLSENLVIEVLNLIKRPDLGVKFFIWAGRQIGYSHTGPVYNALLDIIERGNNNRVPEQFLSEIRSDDGKVLEKLLNGLIRKCCRNGLWNVALEELGRLKDFGYKPIRSTYNALIKVFLKADRIDTAFLVHREMSAAGHTMDGFTLGCFVHSLCKAGRWKEALTLIEKEEFVPDTVLYTKMISGLCEASHFEEAMEFLNRMRASSCVPNVVTYRILLCGCLRKRQLDQEITLMHISC